MCSAVSLIKAGINFGSPIKYILENYLIDNCCRVCWIRKEGKASKFLRLPTGKAGNHQVVFLQDCANFCKALYTGEGDKRNEKVHVDFHHFYRPLRLACACSFLQMTFTQLESAGVCPGLCFCPEGPRPHWGEKSSGRRDPTCFPQQRWSVSWEACKQVSFFSMFS